MSLEKTDGMIRHTRLSNELLPSGARCLRGRPCRTTASSKDPRTWTPAMVRPVRLSQLFSTPTRRPLIIYHFMYGKKQTLPCPPAAVRAHARARGWRRLRLLSAGDSTFKFDLRTEDAEGRQDSATSVFTLDADGTVRHCYTNHPWLADDMHERGEDLTIPLYTPAGSHPCWTGDFYTRLDYGVDVHWGAYPPAS